MTPTDPIEPVAKAERRSMRGAAIFGVIGALATMGCVGVYLAGAGTDGAAAVGNQSVPVGLTPGASPDRDIVVPDGTTKPLAARARAEAAKLPTGELTQKERRIALRGYIDAIGLNVNHTASPSAAARSACRLLGTGTEPADLVEGMAEGGRLTRAESRAFLLGAATLYCPSEAKPFER